MYMYSRVFNTINWLGTTPDRALTTCTASTATSPWPRQSLRATGTWVRGTGQERTPSRSSRLSPSPPARPVATSSSRCTTPRSAFLCHPVSRSRPEPCSRPRGQTPTSSSGVCKSYLLYFWRWSFIPANRAGVKIYAKFQHKSRYRISVFIFNDFRRHL